MKQLTMSKLLIASLACSVFGLAAAQTAAPAAKAPAAAKVAPAKKDDAQAKAEDRAVANYKKNKGMATAAPAKK